ncbi:hypothetical protein LOTGIDRAFT_157157 [Lottia gigantea]|uniref:Uncharacterized protein n=1 Tax=Lottia gigantea TaxID=225164 RepID=V4B3Q9_LOTGI|nr:hypothetical protein LOTGIDRAFT_157157 [Lottia gigantea]ESP02026.1 hypothetical protein LOTGIDRAFT_157157 [Lottia gigantea]
MATSYKNPPKFGEDISYETWKNELEVWRLMTDVNVKKQALAVTLTLFGREKAIEIAAADLNKDDGMKTLIDKLFKKDEKDAAYEAYSNFDKFKKTGEISMSEYVNEFEQKYQKAKKYDMTISDAVLAYKLLYNANLSNTERKLALTATVDGTLKSMKSALMRIFTDSASKPIEDKSTGISVKEESALHTGQKYKKQPYQQSKTTTSHFKETDRRSGTEGMAVSDCPHRVSNVNYSECGEEEELCNMTLFTKSGELSKNEVFMTEYFGCAVLDTACSKIVCGMKWIDNYIDSLPTKEKGKVKKKNSNKEFKFGDGVSKQSMKYVNIPVKIAGVYCNIDTEVVEADIPLLLSKESLKRANTVFDLAHDKASIFKRPVQLQFTSSGHYCIDLRDEIQGVSDETPEDVMIFEENLSQKEKIKMLEKLHKQFGHATSDRLKKLIVSAGHDDRYIFKLLDDLVKKCVVCQRFQRPQHKPAVGFPLASEFNDTVAVDLHQLDKN